MFMQVHIGHVHAFGNFLMEKSCFTILACFRAQLHPSTGAGSAVLGITCASHTERC